MNITTAVYALLIAFCLWAVATFYAEGGEGPQLIVDGEEIHPSCASIEKGMTWLDEVVMNGVIRAQSQGCQNVKDPECAAINDTILRARNLRRYLDGWHEYHCLDV